MTSPDALPDTSVVVRAVIENLPDHQEARSYLDRMVEHSLSSGAIYELLHVVAVEKTEATELATFNGTNFRRMPPKGPTELTVLPS